MILLKTVVLFVLANPAEFYPLTAEEAAKPCGVCSHYLRQIINGVYVVPIYPTYSASDLLKNQNYPCGQANEKTKPVVKDNNITMAKNSKIIGGSVAEPNEFPWQVGIANGLGGQMTCGGSIISSKEILTAGHCVQQKNTPYKLYAGEDFPIIGCIYAVVGAHDTSQKQSEQWNRICNVKKHPDYKGKVIELINDEEKLVTHRENDFAVLTMCSELLFKHKVSPVCLPTPDSFNYDRNRKVIASGWGKTNYAEKSKPGPLKKVDLVTMDNSECFNPPMLWNPRGKHESKICAYDSWGEKGPCLGDSGGPVVYRNQMNANVYYYLIGVSSYGMTCVKRGYPTVLGRVTEAMKWIKKKVNPDQTKGIQGVIGRHPVTEAPANRFKYCRKRPRSGNPRSLKNTEEFIYYYFGKVNRLSREKAQETCISKYGGQLTSINTKDEYEWIKEQVKDLKMFGQIAIGGQWKDKSSRKFEWTDKSEMDMSVLNANWFRTRNYRFPSYKNKKRINLELWYSRRAMGFANTFHKAPTMYICKVAESCTSCSSCSA